MLRESSVPYSSLPQEENDQIHVTTRITSKPNPSSKNRLLTIILVLLVVCGVPLLIITPLALRKNGHGVTSANQAVHWAFPHPESHKEDNLKDGQSALSSTSTPSPQVAILVPEIKTTTVKTLTRAPPVTTIKSTTTTTTTTPPPPPPTTTSTTTTTTTTPAPNTTPRIVIVPTHPVLKPIGEGSVGGAGKNQSGDAAGPTEKPHSQKGEEGSEGGSVSGSPEGGNEDGISFTSSQGFSTMMKNFMAQHEWWTLVAMVVAVALAIAGVIATIAWIIHNRIASRRRRTNLQKVITDLQSKDKVVLLNSEDSEDEA